MFTGIIRTSGRIRERGSDEISIIPDSDDFLSGVSGGDSIAVNGVCLTVSRLDQVSFAAFLSEETRLVTTLGKLPKNETVNLEKPLRLDSFLHGHIVQGHVDCVGMIEEFFRTGGGWTLRIRVPEETGRYIVAKGSVAVDGISLTVAAKRGVVFDVSVIPETVERTNLKRARQGLQVNVEADVIGRYVESLFPGNTG